MKLKLAILFTLLSVFVSNAAFRVEAWVSITNNPVGNTQTLVWNSALTRTWTNSAGDASTQIQTTNSIRNARTNLQSQLSSYLFTNGYSVTYGTNTNDVIIYGLTNAYFTIAIGGLWAKVDYYTNTVYGSSAYTVPYVDVNSNSFRIFQQSHIVTNLNYATQKVSSTSYPFTNFPHSMRTENPSFTNLSTFGGTNRPNDFLATNGGMRNVWASNMLVTNLTGTILSATLTSNTDTNGTYTNAIRINVSILLATNTTLLGGSASNMVLTNISWLNGYLGGLTNGQLVNVFLTNLPSAQVTNLNAYGGTLSNFIAHTMVVTNLSAPGSGANSQRIGASSTASGNSAVAYGVGAVAAGDYTVAVGTGAEANSSSGISIGTSAESQLPGDTALGTGAQASGGQSLALGPNASAGHTNSTALGKGATTTTTNQIVLGTSSEQVKIPGRLADSITTNLTIKGVNTVSGRFDYGQAFNSGLANGYNSGVRLGTNVWVKMSGYSGAVTNAGFVAESDGARHTLQFANPGLSVAILHNSGIEGTSANRIWTGTGGVVVSTNDPAMLEIIYDGDEGHWWIISFR